MQRRARAGSLDDHLERDLEAAGDLLGPGLLGVEQLVEDLRRRLHRLVEGGEEALLLAGELLVEGREGDARRLGDQLDRGLLVAALGDQLRGRQQHPLALVLGDEVARDQVPSRGHLGEPFGERSRIRHAAKVPKHISDVYFLLLQKTLRSGAFWCTRRF